MLPRWREPAHRVGRQLERFNPRRGEKTMNANDETIYKVVVNHEEQYSIWFADRDLPAGWKEAGKEGVKEECLAYIEQVWKDMRPLSLRKQMDKAG
jgi:MbtH protein